LSRASSRNQKIGHAITKEHVMALIVVADDWLNQKSLGPADDLFIAHGATIVATNTYGTHGTGSNHSVNVQGKILGGARGISLEGGLNSSGNHVLIGEDAYVSTDGAYSDGAAVMVQGHSSLIENRGTISGEGTALLVGGLGADKTTVVINSGVIESANDAAVSHNPSSNDMLMLENSGTIKAAEHGAFAYAGAPAFAKDIIINSGLMEGHIDLRGGDDTYDGTTGEVTGLVLGREGADTLLGGVLAEVFYGGPDNDSIEGGGGNDLLFGDEDDDSGSIVGGSDLINGGNGNDTLVGEDGDDKLYGDAGIDNLNGDDGIDWLYGGTGRDMLTGGDGADKFVFNTKPSSTDRDTITDFKHGSDDMLLENAIFKALGGNGGLKSAYFYKGAKAHDADDHIIYNKATGALYYDDDGKGGHAQVQFATLAAPIKPTLSASDFVVI
jgi:Ca2+-binding RTX toxin-like protein